MFRRAIVKRSTQRESRAENLDRKQKAALIVGAGLAVCECDFRKRLPTMKFIRKNEFIKSTTRDKQKQRQLHGNTNGGATTASEQNKRGESMIRTVDESSEGRNGRHHKHDNRLNRRFARAYSFQAKMAGIIPSAYGPRRFQALKAVAITNKENRKGITHCCSITN